MARIELRNVSKRWGGYYAVEHLDLTIEDNAFVTLLAYFDDMGLYAFSSGINLILIILILAFNALVNKLTGASIDSGIGGDS